MVGEEDAASSASRQRQKAQHVTLQNHGEDEPESDSEDDCSRSTEGDGSGWSQSSTDPQGQPLRDRFVLLQSAAEDASQEEREQAALEAARREGLHLVIAPGTKSGYKGVHLKSSKSKPYQATACGNRKNQHLGRFATAAEAALCYARYIGRDAGAAAAEKQEASPPEPASPAAKQAVATAAAEGLELVRVPSAKSGYKGVIYLQYRSKPFQARASSGGGRSEHLGLFDTAEEAALCYARHERRAAAIAALCDKGLGLGLGEGKASRSRIHKLAKVSPSVSDPCRSSMSASEVLEQAKAQGLHALPPANDSPPTGRSSPVGESSRATPVASTPCSLHHRVFEHARSHCHRRSRDEAFETQGDASRLVRPRAVQAVAQVISPQPQPQPQQQAQPQPQPQPQPHDLPQPQLHAQPQPQLQVSHAPYMLPMMVPELQAMYSLPGMSADVLAATRPIDFGLGAGLPPGSAMLPPGAPLPPGWLPGMHVPYSGMVPMAPEVMSSAGMVPQMHVQMAHWPMMQSVPGAQPNPCAAGTPPGVLQAAMLYSLGWYAGYDPSLATTAAS